MNRLQARLERLERQGNQSAGAVRAMTDDRIDTALLHLCSVLYGGPGGRPLPAALGTVQATGYRRAQVRPVRLLSDAELDAEISELSHLLPVSACDMAGNTTHQHETPND